ncbi:MAG: hypothetical protein RMZ41_010995 [Nostoc sp. DedVER02]|uniref:hypothetical protein n=1 Tax=unclassified Nostoc TaxID=2593658 RepID=UPI002AD4835A|nr:MULTISPECIES: hypothetical protein [unclassified Nostoc]MDZ7984655.1 hypothetical protein [Nostoc sp. DedVER02]MDZ8112560.1 hypothetical protein [Nostoc sp. DedVER01b]
MSVLSLPRLYFTGEISWNPSTPNNFSDLYNQGNNTANTDGANENEFTKKVITIGNSWNFYGDHSSKFVAGKTKIVGGTLPDGSAANYEDNLVGRPVQIIGNIFNNHPTDGRLVDVDPYASWTSQIFFNQLVIGNNDIGITGQRERQMCSYWIDFHRNYNTSGDLIIAGIASAVFQTSIPYDQLQFNGQKDSQILQALQQAMQQNDAQGLMIRLCAYRTLYYQNGIRNKIPQQPRTRDELSELYLKGEVFYNPAYSLIVGSIGVWKKGELATAPAGRYLKSKNPVICVSGSKAIPLGPVVAEINQSRKTLSIDLISTFPEWNSSGQKADFGSVSVGVEDNKGEFTEITSLNYSQYNQQAYESQAGIIDIPLNDSQVQLVEQGQLAFRVNTTGKPVTALEESVYTALSDNRAFYLEQSDTNKQCVIQVMYKGKFAPAGTKLLLAQYDNGNANGSTPLLIPSSLKYIICSEEKQENAASVNKLMASRSGITPISTQERLSASTQSPFVNINTGTVVTADAQGIVTLPVNPIQEGCCNIALIPFGKDESPPCIPETLDTTFSNYVTVRVMPFDDELAKTPDRQLTWDFMYNHIFKVYNLIYPVMSQVIPMNNRQRIEGATMQIRATLGDDNKENGVIHNTMWESTMYMSITRDLSFGKRQLLRRWCDLVERDMQP